MGDDQAPALRVGVVDAHGRPVRVPGLGHWLARVAPRAARGSVTIALVSDARIRALNRQYRGKDYATDVLSFPAAAPPAHSSVHLGDIVIARGVATRQARAQGHARAVELKILALHGLLHLLGYDHEADGGRMRRVEARLRRQGGLARGLIERGGTR
jgi:probable rRNA maturation factor